VADVAAGDLVIFSVSGVAGKHTEALGRNVSHRPLYMDEAKGGRATESVKLTGAKAVVLPLGI
jgi:hypothetical protein